MAGGNSVVGLTAATAVGLVLLVAGAAKLRDPRALQPFLRGLGVEARPAGAAARLLPVGELLVGAWLASAVTPAPAAIAATLLAAGFAAALILATARGVVEPCRCFGTLDRVRSHRVSLARALVVLAGTVTALAGAEGVGPADGGAAWAARALGALLALCAVTAFALVAEVAAFRAGVRQATATDRPRQLEGRQAR